ncbi:hypothetical protein [Mucilaginibacter lacusdianchii]|uniref:hypothetical protein n=1 Tax=Mucilaginibacter lacusdianchii TaxID=2684211 RepID=UPI00131CA25C|nr:hypothetical protein [Mucilaginibacter sp. JXJ CY 39]
MTKKLVAFIILLVLVVTILTYVLIPPYIKIHRQVRVYTTEQAVMKYVMHYKKWSKWWPDASQKFTMQKNTVSEVAGRFVADNVTLPSTVSYTIKDSKGIDLNWDGVLTTGLNPVKRILRYQNRDKIAQQIDYVLTNSKLFLEDDRHVYGIHVQKARIEDSILLSTKRTSKVPLTVKEIYEKLSTLKAYASAHQAKQVSYPMLNITQLNDKQYLTSLAIPVNKWVSAGKDVYIKKLVYHANILTVQVKGGDNSVNNALAQLSVYMRDNNYTAPAIPYEELITDRATVPDTSKWVTRICCPVL